MEGLLTWTAERVAKFPRDHKFTLGDRLLETCIDVMSALTNAAYRRDKRDLLISSQPSASQASGSLSVENSSGRGGVLAYAAASRSDAASMR
jgi:hypothetical protein